MSRKLNLLPKPKQDELYYDNLLHSILVAVFISVGILLLGILAQIVTRVVLTQGLASTEDQIETIQQTIDRTENAALKERIKGINGKMADYENLIKSTPQWSTALDAIVAQVPDGVLIGQLDADLETGEVDISGFSPTRDLVIEFYNNINSDRTHFNNINYPLENVAKPVNVRFQYTFFINPEVLVPK